jgi:hypothetical protein
MKKSFTEIIPKEMLCQNCKIRVGQKLHNCPLEVVFPNSKESQCNCCTFCESKCHDEV